MREYLKVLINTNLKKWLNDKIFRRILKNMGWLVGAKAITTIFVLAAISLKTYSLGSELFGLFSVIIAYVMTIKTLTSLQPWRALIKFGAEALENSNPKEFIELIKFGLVLDIIAAIFGTFVAVSGAHFLGSFFNWSLETIQLAIIMSLSILFSISEGTPTGILRLLNRFKAFTIQQVFQAIVGVIGAIVVYIMNWGIIGFIISALISIIIGNITLFILAYQSLKQEGLLKYFSGPIIYFRDFLRFSIWAYLQSISRIPTEKIDVIIASTVISLEAAGIYSVIKRITILLNQISDPMIMAVFPEFSILVAKRQLKEAYQYSLKIGILLISLFFPVVMIGSLFSPWILKYIFGAEFATGALALSVFLIIKLIPLACSTIHPLFLSLGYAKQSAFLSMTFNMLYLGMAYYLGSIFGLLGLVVAIGLQLHLSVIAKFTILYYKNHFVLAPKLPD